MGETMDHKPDDRAEAGLDEDAVRAAIRAINAAEGLSLAEIARQAGVASGTMTPWLSGHYAGRGERVAARMQTWLDSRSAQRRTRGLLRALPGFIATPTATSFTSTLEYAQTAPDLVLITGGAGVGKTTAAREYQRAASNVWLLTISPTLAGMGPMLEELLGVLGVQERSTSRRSAAARRRVQGSGGLLIVDEAQHLQVNALEELRTLHDQGGIGLALVGNESVQSRLEGKGRTPEFAQLFSRIGTRTRRSVPLGGDIDALLDAWGITEAPLRRMCRVIGRKPGALRVLGKCLRQAHMLAAGEGHEGPLTEALIQRAWSRISDSSSLMEGN